MLGWFFWDGGSSSLVLNLRASLSRRRHCDMHRAVRRRQLCQLPAVDGWPALEFSFLVYTPMHGCHPLQVKDSKTWNDFHASR